MIVYRLYTQVEHNVIVLPKKLCRYMVLGFQQKLNTYHEQGRK